MSTKYRLTGQFRIEGSRKWLKRQKTFDHVPDGISDPIALAHLLAPPGFSGDVQNLRFIQIHWRAGDQLVTSEE